MKKIYWKKCPFLNSIAFVEFKNKAIAEKLQQRKRVIKIQGRVLIVDSVKQANVPKATNANDDNNNTKGKSQCM